MATLWEDVVGHTAYDLEEMRDSLLEEVKDCTPRQLVDKVIRNTLAIIEDQYNIISKGACNSDGTPFYASGLSEEYWRIVNT